jgi:hypothetical protein
MYILHQCTVASQQRSFIVNLQIQILNLHLKQQYPSSPQKYLCLSCQDYCYSPCKTVLTLKISCGPEAESDKNLTLCMVMPVLVTITSGELLRPVYQHPPT